MLCTVCLQAEAQYVSEVWVSDQGNGTYRNPVLHADYSDPDVCAAGDDFYMTASSFGCGLRPYVTIKGNFTSIGATRISASSW